jgi:hypothetical protein
MNVQRKTVIRILLMMASFRRCAFLLEGPLGLSEPFIFFRRW